MRNIALIALLALAPAMSRAETVPTTRETTSVRAAGEAGASIGYASDTDAMHVNPAGIAATPHFDLEIAGFFGVPSRYYMLSAGAVDSKLNSDDTVPISGGVSYQYYQSGKGFEARKGHIVSVAVAAPIYPEYAFIGLTTRYFKFAGQVVSNAATIDLGVMIKPIPLIGIGIAGYNLIDTNSAEARRGWGFGLAVGKETSFHVDIDARLDPDATGTLKPAFAVGGEYLFINLIAPRLGYSEDRLRGAHLLTAGLSVIYQGFAIEVFYRHAILGDEKTFGLAVRMIDF
jgi:hypothetical protein